MDDAMGRREVKGMSPSVARLYDDHITAAVRFAYLLSGDEALAQDLAHDAFIRVAGKLGSLRSPDKVGPYLRTAIVNAFRSHLRRVRRERRHLERGASVTPSSVEQPDVATRNEIRRALDLLPPRRRAAVILRYYEDMTERQTADVLGCSVPAVKALVARGLDGLRAGLEGETDD